MNIGCAAAPDLTLTSLDQHHTWREPFSHAYSRRDGNGNLDIVLIDRPTEVALSGHRPATPVRQVMYIHVLWTPARETKAVTCNAAIKWYVIGDRKPQDLLEYSGTGFVSWKSQDNGHARVWIQNALLKAAENHGSLTDPVGSSRLQGSILARANSQRVAKVLDDLHVTLAAAVEERAAANEPADPQP